VKSRAFLGNMMVKLQVLVTQSSDEL